MPEVSLRGFFEIAPSQRNSEMRSIFVKTKEITHAAILERAELYFLAHPGSPSTVRRPKLFSRQGIWVALLGPNLEEGIAGLGATPEAALHAFDVRYLSALRPQNEVGSFRRTA